MMATASDANASSATEDPSNNMFSLGGNNMILEDPASYMDLMSPNDDELAESLLPTTFFNTTDHANCNKADATATLLMMDQAELNDIAGLLAPPVSDDDSEEGQDFLLRDTQFSSCSVTNSDSGESNHHHEDKPPVFSALPDLPPLKLLPKQKKNAAGSTTSTTKKRFLYDQEVKSLACHTKKVKMMMPALLENNPVVDLLPAPLAIQSQATVVPASPTLSASKSAITKDSAKVDTAPLVPVVSSTSTTSKTATATKATTAKSNNNSNTTGKKTDAERAQQCRDRNRQHAKNTRLRKKAFVESLKESLQQMVQDRDAKLVAEQQADHVLVQQREVRFQVMQDFLQLKARREPNAERWSAILDHGCSVTQPVTPYQHMVGTTSSTDPYRQVLQSVEQLQQDAAYFHQFVQSTLGGDVGFGYSCDRKDFFMDGCTAVLPWTGASEGAVHKGSKAGLKLYGTMKATFCPDTNKLKSVVLLFDTGAVHTLLRADSH